MIGAGLASDIFSLRAPVGCGYSAALHGLKTGGASMVAARRYPRGGAAAVLAACLLAGASGQAAALDVETRLAKTWVQEGRKAYALQSQVYLQNLHALARPGANGTRQVDFAVIYDTSLPREEHPAFQVSVGTYEFDCLGKYRVLRNQKETLEGRIVAKIDEPGRWWPATGLSTAEAHACGRATSPLANGAGLDEQLRWFLEARGKPLPAAPAAAVSPIQNSDPNEMQGDNWAVISFGDDAAAFVDMRVRDAQDGAFPRTTVVMTYSKQGGNQAQRAVGDLEVDCAGGRIRIDETSSVHYDGRLDQNWGDDQGQWVSLARTLPVMQALCMDRATGATGLRGYRLHELQAGYFQLLRSQGKPFTAMKIAVEFCPVEFTGNDGKRYYASTALAPVQAPDPGPGLAGWAAAKSAAPLPAPVQCQVSSLEGYFLDRARSLQGFHQRAFANGQEPVILTEQWRPPGSP